MVNFLTDGTRSTKHLINATDYLTKRGQRAGASDWVRRDSKQSIDAIVAFQGTYNRIGVRTLDCRLAPSRLPVLDEWATRVSVDIDVTIHVPTKEGRDRIGAAILLFSRGEASSNRRIEQSKTIASLNHRFCVRFIFDQGDPEKKLCFAIDVFGGQAYGPQGIRKLDHIRDACDEIASRWEAIGPPADYDGPDF